MFWRRALSVVVLLPLVLLIIYWGDWLYLLLVSVAVVMMQVEYCRLAQHFTEKLNPVIPALLTGVFGLCAYFLPTLTKTVSASTVIFSFFTFVFIYVFAESIFRAKVAGELLAVTLKLTGILTIGWALGYHLILLRNAEPIGRQLIFLLAGIVWCSDTGAYLVGRAFGKHRLGHTGQSTKDDRGNYWWIGCRHFDEFRTEHNPSKGNDFLGKRRLYWTATECLGTTWRSQCLTDETNCRC